MIFQGKKKLRFASLQTEKFYQSKLIWVSLKKMVLKFFAVQKLTQNKQSISFLKWNISEITKRTYF